MKKNSYPVRKLRFIRFMLAKKGEYKENRLFIRDLRYIANKGV
jgi:hypothetical protein